MVPGGNWYRKLGVAYGLVGLGIIPVNAAAESPKVDVDCPEMTPEQRASVEARSRAELAMLGVTEGEIGIRCWPPLALVQYSVGGVPVHSSSRHLGGEVDAWIDQILATLHESFAPREDPRAAATQARSEPEQPPQVSVASPPSDSFPGANPVTPRRFSAPPVAVASQWKPEAQHAERLRIQTSIGACAEVWAKPLELLPGACALFGLRSSFSRIALVGGVQWSVSRVHDIGIRHWQAGVEWSLGYPLWFALSGQLSVFQLMPSTSLSPSSNTKYDPSITMRGGISLPTAGKQLRAGAGVRLQPGHEVHINGNPVFSVPIVALTLDVAYEFEL